MTGRYSALGAPGGDIGGFPTQRSTALSYDSGTAYSSDDEKPNAATKGQGRAIVSCLASLLGLPMFLHVGVLALYIALCVVWITGAEQNIEVALTSASRIQTWLNLISHLIMLAFSTAIVALMQPIATRSPFGNLAHTLTSLSDKISAWNGLGSALLNLYHNLCFPATLSNAAIVMSYFSTLSGLGISSSFLFNAPAVNETVTSNVTTQIGSPAIRSLVIPGQPHAPTDFTNVTFDWYRSGVSVGMLLNNNTTAYPGLSANRIYDTLSSPLTSSPNSTAIIGYTDFDVKCGAVPHVSLSASGDETFFLVYRVSNTTDTPAMPTLQTSGTSDPPTDLLLPTFLHINYTLGHSKLKLSDQLQISWRHGINVSESNPTAVSRLWQPADVLVRVPNAPLVPGIGRNVILYNIYNETGLVSGSQVILDSENAEGAPLSLNVHVPNPTSGDWQHNTTLTATSLKVQVIGCSLSTRTGLAHIDASTNRLISTPSSLNTSAPSTWANWRPDLRNATSLEDTWASMFLPNVGSIGLWDNQPMPPPTQWSCLTYAPLEHWDQWNRSQLQGSYNSCHVPTAIEEYLTTRLFGAVETRSESGDAIRDPSAASATLATLESALADATAMTMWSAARASTLKMSRTVESHDLQSIDNSVLQGASAVLTPALNSTVVVEQVLIGRITFNAPALLIGMTLAAVLNALGAYILVKEDVARLADAPINDAGLLSLMMLDNSSIAARLSSSNMRTVQSRRRAGDFLVRVVDGQLVIVEDANKDPGDGNSLDRGR